MQKFDIRRYLIQKRRTLREKEIYQKSEAIKDKFLVSELYRSADTLALYSSFGGEVRTDAIIESALNDKKGVLVPKVDLDNNSMAFVSVSPEDDLSKVSDIFSDFHRESKIAVLAVDIDLIVVPGVAFDMSGNRLGMGKGFYDRALKDVGKGKIAALAYEFQLIGKVPVYGHDVGVGWIITEERILDVINNNG